MEQKRILLFGASGRTGVEILKQLVNRQYDVTAYVRNAEKLNAFAGKVQIVSGQLSETDRIKEVILKNDIIISALGPENLKADIQPFVTGIKNILQALDDSPDKPFVYLSAMGVGDSIKKFDFISRLLMKTLLAKPMMASTINEQSITHSKTNWVIVRLARLIDKPVTGKYCTKTEVLEKINRPCISRQDVAHFISKLVENCNYSKQILSIFYK